MPIHPRLCHRLDQRVLAAVALVVFAACADQENPTAPRPDAPPPRFTTSGTTSAFTSRTDYVAAVPNDLTNTAIGFDTFDDGSPLYTDASGGWLLSGVTLHNVFFGPGLYAYYNLFLSAYNNPNEIRAALPPNTFAAGYDLLRGYGQPSQYTCSSSNTDPVQLPGETPFFGVISSSPIAWISCRLAGDWFLVDNFVFGVRTDPGATSPGSDVQVTPLDQTTGQPAPVQLTFDNVVAGGSVSVASGQVGPNSTPGAPPAPSSSNFRLGSPPLFYNITLNNGLQFTGSVVVCVTYPAGAFRNTSNLQLLHYTGTTWEVLPNQRADLATRTVCGETTSFSPFMIAELEVAPVVTRVSLATEPIPVNTSTSLVAMFADGNLGDVHTGTFSWGGSPVAGAVAETDGAGMLIRSQSFSTAGVYRVTATVSDGALEGSRSSALDVPSYLVVYNPSAGFVTGGGWITSPAGACTASVCTASTGAGKATFGFVAKYEKGANAPSGNTQFQFATGGLEFASTSYQWLVVSGDNRAQFKGSGVITGRPGIYQFLLTAVDGDAVAGGADSFRIKLIDEGAVVVYDNRRDASDDNATTVLGGGSIKIHK